MTDPRPLTYFEQAAVDDPRPDEELPTHLLRARGRAAKKIAEVTPTVLSVSTFTFTVIHRTDEPIEDLGEALARSWDGHAVGQVTEEKSRFLPDERVADELVALGNDGTFFNDDLGVDDDEEGEFEDEDCNDECAAHDPGCDGFCDHTSDHKNACLLDAPVPTDALLGMVRRGDEAGPVTVRDGHGPVSVQVHRNNP